MKRDPDAPPLVHPTYRHLERPVRLSGLTLRQWTLLVGAGAVAYALAQLLPFSATYDLSVAVTIVGVPVAVALATADTGVSLPRYLRDALRWRRSRRIFQPGVRPTRAPAGYRTVPERAPEPPGLHDDRAAGGAAR